MNESIAEARERLQIVKLICCRCGHTWIPRNELMPIACPRCKTFKWRKENSKNENQQTLNQNGGIL